jgi:hypothetical protein
MGERLKQLDRTYMTNETNRIGHHVDFRRLVDLMYPLPS